jgi:hypothetical protein
MGGLEKRAEGTKRVKRDFEMRKGKSTGFGRLGPEMATQSFRLGGDINVHFAH